MVSCTLCGCLEAAAWLYLILSVFSYLIPFLLQAFYLKEQNLKVKYNAEWAVVTGASSGIGRAITEKLAEQKINVVMVALEKGFDEPFEQISKQFPDVSFRKVKADLGRDPEVYMKAIQEATADIKPNLIFNNAGYIITGMFADTEVGAQLANFNCNATSAVHITHYFLNRILDAKQTGAVFFTSSPAGWIPNPTTVMYGATKIFLTQFASSLAAEVKADGIDVLVVHPSAVATAFYAGNKHDVDSLKMAQKVATTAGNVASCFFISVGRYLVHDQGLFPVIMRLALRVLDYNLVAYIISVVAPMMGDYKKVKQARKPKDQ